MPKKEKNTAQKNAYLYHINAHTSYTHKWPKYTLIEITYSSTEIKQHIFQFDSIRLCMLCINIDFFSVPLKMWKIIRFKHRMDLKMENEEYN